MRSNFWLPPAPTAPYIVADWHTFRDLVTQTSGPGAPFTITYYDALVGVTAGKWAFVMYRFQGDADWVFSGLTVGGVPCQMTQVDTGAVYKVYFGVVQLTRSGNQNVVVSFSSGTSASKNSGLACVQLYDAFAGSFLSIGATATGVPGNTFVSLTTTGDGSAIFALNAGANNPPSLSPEDNFSLVDWRDTYNWETGAYLLNAGVSGSTRNVVWATSHNYKWVVEVKATAAPTEPRYARPISDMLAGDWQASTGVILFEMVNEVTSDDGNYIWSVPASTAEMGLTAVIDPQSSNYHTVRVRAKTDRAASDLRVSLYQGTTLIAQWTQALTNSYVTYEFDLTGPQIDSITDYTALSVRVEAL